MSVAALEVGPCVVCRKPARRAGGSRAQFRCAGSCSVAPTEGAAADLRFCDDPAAQKFVADREGKVTHDGCIATLDEVGEFFGISGERVRQIQAAALAKLLKRLHLAGVAREDLAMFVSQRSGGHPLETSRRPKSPSDIDRDAARHQQRKTCACGAAKKMRAPACRPCMGLPPKKHRGTDAGNVSQAIDRLPPSEVSVNLDAIARSTEHQAQRLAAKVERVGPVLDALREWMATAPQVDIEFPEDGQ